MGDNKGLFAAANAHAPKPPCGKECSDRKAGCAISCKKWAAYLRKREAFYEARRQESELNCKTAGRRIAASRSIRQKKNEPGWH